MSSPLWDAALLARIAHLHLEARRLVEGWRQGGHRSIRTTSAIEFVDHQEYAPGDSIRHLDWKVAARTDRLVIRRHAAEREVPVTLAIDFSGDLETRGWDADSGTKLDSATLLGASLAVFLHRRGDPVGLEVMGGQGIEHRSIPAGSRTLPSILRSLAEVKVGGTADLARTFSVIGARLPRKSVLILISDLMEEPAEWGPQVAALVRRGIDLRVVHLHDPNEWTLRFVEPSQLYSPEGGDDLPLDPASAREAMADVIEQYVQEVRSHLGRQRARHYLVAHDAPLDGVLRQVLGGRS